MILVAKEADLIAANGGERVKILINMQPPRWCTLRIVLER